MKFDLNTLKMRYYSKFYWCFTAVSSWNTDFSAMRNSSRGTESSSRESNSICMDVASQSGPTEIAENHLRCVYLAIEN